MHRVIGSSGDRAIFDDPMARSPDLPIYFTSLCGVCLRHRAQNFFFSIRSGVVFRFFMVE
jgi:hypothetical protein